MKKAKWVSELIGDKYKQWKNEVIILDCGTGTGKTTFCLEELGEYAQEQNKKILYLCNRLALQAQVENEIADENNCITVMTYQSLENMLRQRKSIPYYDYIFADECHYFTMDALFNEYTDLSFEYIKTQNNSVVIYMSATANAFFNWMIENKKVKKKNVYRIHKNYDYVDSLVFFKKYQLIAMIERILATEDSSKMVIFCSGKRIKEMFKYFGEKATYNCSKNSSDAALKKICMTDESLVEGYDDGLTFEKRILFTTTVLDNGVTLKDYDIKHIFCEVIDVDTMIQCLGRKRCIDEKDTCNFYIREYRPQDIQSFININTSRIEPVDLYLNDSEAFYQKYGEDRQRDKIRRNPIFYMSFTREKKGTVKLNKMRYNKYAMDIEMYELYMNLGYSQTILMILKELDDRVEWERIQYEKKDEFLEYLKQIENIPLYKEQQEDIREQLSEIGYKIRRLGINTLNGVLQDRYKNEYDCRFTNRDSSTGKTLTDKRRILPNGLENPNRDKRYWILQKISKKSKK